MTLPPPVPVELFRDRRFVVLNKPAGLPVHPGPSGGRSVEDWFRLLSRRKDGPWLAHRLDADTSGCLVAGQSAVTEWRVLGRATGLTWLELLPKTGRTHQVRVHCLALGTPIVGDERYGGRGGGLLLLARCIHLPLDPPVDATAEPPPHMIDGLKRCGFRR